MKRLIVAFLVFGFAAACTSTGALFAKGVAIGARIVRGVAGTNAERDALCAYYIAHRDEVDAVREFAKASWERIPDEHKPALLAINEHLNDCEVGDSVTPTKRTKASVLLDALKRIVSLYGDLKASGVL
jgi:hypothetical protein